MIDNLCVFIIAMCFFISGFALGWKSGEEFGERGEKMTWSEIVKQGYDQFLKHHEDLEYVIRCKDCKYSEPWYKDKRRCFLWHETGIDVFEDGYCNYSKRKEVEDAETIH